MRFAVDTGGTFTDLVVEDDDGAAVALQELDRAVGSRSGDPRRLPGRRRRARRLARRSCSAPARVLIHGTTRGLNAVLTGNTARTAFLTTEGHPDILLFREGGRTEIFDLSKPYPGAVRPARADLRGAGADRARTAAVLRPLDEPALVATARGGCASAGVEAVAVCLLWSIVNPAHELRVGELVAEHLPGVPFTLSHQLNPCVREYRRASSTCIDASLKPVMTAYIADRRAAAERRRLRAGGS